MFKKNDEGGLFPVSLKVVIIGHTYACCPWSTSLVYEEPPYGVSLKP